MSRNCVVWVVDENHRAEQQVSEERVKRFMPDVGTLCLSVERSPEFPMWYENYIIALQTTLTHYDYDRFLFLDSDALILEPVDDIFDLLENYDIVSTHAPARQTTDMPKGMYIPDTYPELNTGVLGYANNERVKNLFETWLYFYNRMFEVSGDNDQAPLRAAMYTRGTKCWVMPPEYNFRYGFGAFAGSRVKILHGRSENLDKLIEDVNAQKSMRTFARGSLR